MPAMTDEEYKHALLEKYDVSTETERRALFVRALERIDETAMRHYQVIDAYEDLLQS